MRLQKPFFSIWFNIKKVTRTSVAVALFVSGLVAAFDYIHAETSALETSRHPLPMGTDLVNADGIRVDGR